MYDKFDKAHDILVRKAIDSRYLTLALFLFAFIASLFLLPMLGTEFIPRVDRGLMEISMELSSASSLLHRRSDGSCGETCSLFTWSGGNRSSGGRQSSRCRVNQSRLRIILSDDPRRPLPLL